MKKKEFAVGEEFQFGLVKLKVVKLDKAYCCGSCYLYNAGVTNCNLLIGACSAEVREDGIDVQFVEVEEEE